MIRRRNLIEGAADREAAAIEDVGVDHRGFDIAMAEEVLDRANIVAVFQKMSGEGMAERVAGHAFGDVGAAAGEANGFLEAAAAGVVPAADTGARVGRDLPGGEHELPDPLACCARVFAGEGFGKVDGAEAICEIGLVEGADGGDVAPKRLDQSLGQDRDAVPPGLRISDKDLVEAEVDVFDAEADAFREAEAATIEELGHEPVGRWEGVDEEGHFAASEDGGEAFGAAGADGVDHFVDRCSQDGPEEEQDCAEGLVLGGGGDLAFDGEVREESADVGGAEVAWEAAAVEENEAADPAEVADFGAEGVVFPAKDEARLFENSGSEGVHGNPLVVDGEKAE
jgi:hypothetical protein